MKSGRGKPGHTVKGFCIMPWHKNDCFQPDRCNQCRSSFNVAYSRAADEYLCEECLPFALAQIEGEENARLQLNANV